MKTVKHIQFLQKDPVMKNLIEKFGELEHRGLSEDLLTDLVESVVGQQLSLKAADTIWGRVKDLLPEKKLINPEHLLAITDEALRACGVSFAKIRSIKGIAQEVFDNTLDLHSLVEMADEEVSERLQQLRGIGPWTAEMLMIFSLGREDVFSPGDMGLRNAIAKLYKIEKTNVEAMVKLAENWKPYRSWASRYLWKSLDNET